MAAAIRAAGGAFGLTRRVLGLGGNIGDSRALIAAALDRLAAHPAITVEAVSALYETPPWGKTDQPPFLNAAARIDTTLSAARIAGGGARGGAAARPRSAPSAGDRARSTSTSSSSEPTRSTSRACTSRTRIFTSAPSRSPRWSTSCRTRGFPGGLRQEWLARADSAGMTRLAGPDWHKPGKRTAPRAVRRHPQVQASTGPRCFSSMPRDGL